jgi:hypothetical protein
VGTVFGEIPLKVVVDEALIFCYIQKNSHHIRSEQRLSIDP